MLGLINGGWAYILVSIDFNRGLLWIINFSANVYMFWRGFYGLKRDGDFNRRLLGKVDYFERICGCAVLQEFVMEFGISI